MIMKHEIIENYTENIANSALAMEKVFSGVSPLKGLHKLEQFRSALLNAILLPNQMMYLICYNPRGIYYARNTEKFLPYLDEQLTIERIINSIAAEDSDFVAHAIRAIYDWSQINPDQSNETLFTIEHRMTGKDNETLYVQRNSQILEVDENNLPVLAVSIITNLTHLVQGPFMPRATLFNPRTNEQYFYKEPDKNKQLWVSKREQEVLELLCKGLSSKQIAELLFISRHTVDGHRRLLLEKTETTCTPELICFAHRNNWVS
jgi:DNA-binding CsgD family transcriptional regulator